MENYYEQCKAYSIHDCYTCAYTCDGWGCNNFENWTPSRGGHPSTQNPCESTAWINSGLIFEDCVNCPRAIYDD